MGKRMREKHKVVLQRKDRKRGGRFVRHFWDSTTTGAKRQARAKYPNCRILSVKRRKLKQHLYKGSGAFSLTYNDPGDEEGCRVTTFRGTKSHLKDVREDLALFWNVPESNIHIRKRPTKRKKRKRR